MILDRCQSQEDRATPGVWCSLRPGHDAGARGTAHSDPTGQRRWRNTDEVTPRRGDYPSQVALAAVAVLAASEVCRVTAAEILGTSRVRHVAHARHVAAAVIRFETPLSLPQIAALMNREDHTTILNSVRRVESDPVLSARAARARVIVRAVIPIGGNPVEGAP